MIKIKLIRDTVCDGSPVRTGETVDASDKDGKYLVNTGKAVYASNKPAKKRNKALSTKDLETR